MAHSPFERSRPEPKSRLVVYQFAPSGFLGRLFALAVAALVLVAAFFLSLMIFWLILSVVLFVIVYAWWVSRRGRARNVKDVNVDPGSA